MTQRVESMIYIVGLIFLGLAYCAVEHTVSAPGFVTGVIAFLVLLRVFGRFIAAKIAPKKSLGDKVWS